jgi:hypothetical protein
VGPPFVATAHPDGERGAKLFAERIIWWITMAKDQIQRKRRSAIFAISNRLGCANKSEWLNVRGDRGEPGRPWLAARDGIGSTRYK